MFLVILTVEKEMEAFLTLAKMVAAIAITLVAILAALVGEFVSRYSDAIGFVAVAAGLYLLYRYRFSVWVWLTLTPHRLHIGAHKFIRGFKPWLWWPVQRAYHKWRRRSYLTGGLMAKAFAGTVLAIIDEALLKASVEGKISRKQYNDVMRIMGLLLGDVRFVPRKPMHPEERAAYVRENIASVKAGPKGSIPGPPEPTEGKPKVVRLHFLRNRGSRAA